MSEIRILFKFQDNRRSATEEEKTMSIPPSQTDVKLFAQDDDEKLFDIVNSPLASFHESERSCQETSDQVSEILFQGHIYILCGRDVFSREHSFSLKHSIITGNFLSSETIMNSCLYD